MGQEMNENQTCVCKKCFITVNQSGIVVTCTNGMGMSEMKFGHLLFNPFEVIFIAAYILTRRLSFSKDSH